MSVRLRPLALPVEHGGWGFLFEPILIGLIAAWSWAALLLGLAALGVFLIRQPLKIALTDRMAGRRLPRTPIAWAVAAGYALAAGGLGLVAARWAVQPFWIVVVIAAPPAIVQFVYDARGEGRRLVPELLGPAALAGVAAAMALATGRPLGEAVVLWTVAAMRTLPAIVGVRAQVQRLHGLPAPRWPAFVAHDAAVMLAVILAAAGWLRLWAVALLLVLAVRAMVHLRPAAPTRRAQAIGTRELVTGLVSAIVLGLLLH